MIIKGVKKRIEGDQLMGQTALIMLGVGIFAGIAGAILGIGGGMIITPILTLGMGLNIKYAIGASIIAVIATSSGSTIAYLRDNVLNLRVAMFLEIATTIGAIVGALLTGVLDPKYLYLLFGCLLVFSSWNMYRKLRRGQEVLQRVEPDKIATKLKLNGSYYDKAEMKDVDYQVENVPAGFSVMFGAGVASGLLGIGSGAFKVMAMDTFMKMPLKPSSSTSNLMMGVTAAASATVYFFNGSILPTIAVPMALGILVGAVLGSRIMQILPSRWIRIVFIPVLLYIGGQMLFKGLGVHF
ncbi:permease [Levilactobacillus acidifarinae DSM 19394]|uniref:Probable membrane transporter protein n=2 Tax=Levilactobacillus acidifarinae TaxID=267364 RepID=A0A0R1LTR9_9LACO|nr:permease [Levilactobacillus acidifarinae DSM 19394]